MKRIRWWKIRRAIVFWWQRRTRGWDDSDTWNLDQSLAELILPRLRRFAELPHGYPCDTTSEQWKADLDTMIRTFETIISPDYYEIMSPEQYEEKIGRGLDLFAKNFGSLWS